MNRTTTRRLLFSALLLIALAVAALLVWQFPVRKHQRYQEAVKKLERYANVQLSDVASVELREKKLIENTPSPEAAVDFAEALAIVNEKTPVVALKLDERDWVGYWDPQTNVVPVGEHTSKDADGFIAAILARLPDAAPALKSLIVKHTEIDASMFQTIGRLTRLESLALVGPWKEGAAAKFDELKTLSGLTRLTIVGDAVLATDHLRVLGSFAKLEQLNLLADLREANLAELAALSRLKVLVLRGARLPHDSLPVLPNLESLSLGGGASGELSHLLRNLAAAPKLKLLSLLRFANEDRAAVLEIFGKMPALEEVRWTSFTELVDDAKLLPHLSKLCATRPRLKLNDHDLELPSLLNASSWSVVKRPFGKENEYELAHAQAVLAVDLRPEDADIKNTLGAALYRVGKLHEAKDVLDDTCRRSKGHPADHACLALVHLALGNEMEARRHLASAKERSRSHPRGALDPDTPDLIDEVERQLAKGREKK